jgi:kinesin family protein 11
LFEELLKHVHTQKAEANELRQQLYAATEAAMQSNAAMDLQLDTILQEERQQAAEDRQNLLAQITSLVTTQGEKQDQRLRQKIGNVRTEILSSKESFEASREQYSQGMDTWNQNEEKLVEEVLRSRETLKTKLKDDWMVSSALIIYTILRLI